MSKIKDPVIFSIKQADIGAFLAADTNLSPNSGSAFYKAAPAHKAGMDIKTIYGGLLADKEFLRSLRIIAQPDLYLAARTAGAQGLSEIRLHRKKARVTLLPLRKEMRKAISPFRYLTIINPGLPGGPKVLPVKATSPPQTIFRPGSAWRSLCSYFTPLIPSGEFHIRICWTTSLWIELMLKFRISSKAWPSP